MNRYFYLLQRPEHDGGETASVEIYTELEGQETVWAAFRRGVTRWVKETPEGRDRWEYSSEDLNIGDLGGSDYDDERFGEILRQEGIDSIKVLQYAVDEFRQYDEVLVDRETLEKPGTGTWDPKSHWDVHPEYPVADWQYEVDADDTRLGYHDWVRGQLEAAEMDKNQ